MVNFPYEPPPCIIVPVYNAAKETELCVDAVLRETREPYRLLVLDDASPDSDVTYVLNRLSVKYPILELYRHQYNMGFAGNVNYGIRACDGDVVLLNSDTVVSDGWLDKLVACAYSRGDVATVTPLSNAAGAFSTPINNSTNRVPEGLDINDLAQIAARAAAATPIEVPTGNGFCLYIRREALERIGLMDSETFPYIGEENDFCQRAKMEGFVNLVDSSCYVYHKRAASFGGEEAKRKLLGTARKEIDRRYPSYKQQVQKFLQCPQLNSSRERFQHMLQRRVTERIRKRSDTYRILSVIHDGGGGLVHTNRDLMEGLARYLDTYVLRCGTEEWTVTRIVDEQSVAKWTFGEVWRSSESTDMARRMALRSIVEVLEIDLVHVRTLICTGPEILASIKGMNAAILVSFHDFNAVCPTTHLVDSEGRYCGGKCTDSKDDCAVARKWFGDVRNLKHFGVYQWRKRMAANLPLADAFVTTTEGTRKLLSEHFPVVAQRPFAIIEHGRDVQEWGDVCVAPGLPMRVVVLGAMNLYKGVELLKAIFALNERGTQEVEFHMLGEVGRRTRFEFPNVVWHGAYERDALPIRLMEIAPSYAVICPIWPETYSHTLTEAWMAGLPVLASRIGATSERISKNGGGRLVDPRKPEEWICALRELRDVKKWDSLRAEVRKIVFRSTAEMANEYRVLYENLIERKMRGGSV